MTETVPTQEGTISYRGHDLAYRMVGDGEAGERSLCWYYTVGRERRITTSSR